jgi:hypothetical protein
MKRKSDRDALLLLLLLGMLGRRSPGVPTTPNFGTLPPGPPPPFPPPGTVPREPETPDPGWLDSFQRMLEETFSGSPIDLEWWKGKLNEWRTQPRPPREPLPPSQPRAPLPWE